MPKFINETMGMVSEADLLATGFMVSRPNDPLEGLFTDQVTDNLVAEWYTMASEYQIPQMAQFHAFDTQAQKSDRAPIDEHNIEKGLIKVKRNTSELLRQLLKRGVRVEETLYDFVMDDNAALSDQVITRAKVARAELLATGQVTIKENGLNEVIDYGVPTNHKNLTLDVGDGAATDVLTQLQNIVDAAAAEGVTITGMVCPKSLLTKLRKNANLQLAINGSSQAGILVRNQALLDFLSEEYGISQVITDDLTYAEPLQASSTKRPTVKAHRYFPNDKVTFFGTQNGMRLGAGLWGTPPEVEIAQFMQVGGSSESPYVYVSQWAETDPAVLWTKASALYMPVLFAPQSLFIASIAETAKAA
ncbi:MAG: major capsid protein [Eggerthellaceae bacterium]|nr:major capsid protein [Eggerthellaceae bacterium]